MDCPLDFSAGRTEGDSQVTWLKTRMFCDTGQHSWTNLLAIVECECEIGIVITREGLVRSRLPLHPPANGLQSSQESLGLEGRPFAHTKTGREKLILTGSDSPFSS